MNWCDSNTIGTKGGSSTIHGMLLFSSLSLTLVTFGIQKQYVYPSLIFPHKRLVQIVNFLTFPKTGLITLTACQPLRGFVKSLICTCLKALDTFGIYSKFTTYSKRLPFEQFFFEKQIISHQNIFKHTCMQQDLFLSFFSCNFDDQNGPKFSQMHILGQAYIKRADWSLTVT